MAAIDTTGYDYGAFVRGIEHLHGTGCFVKRLLLARLRAGTLDVPHLVVGCDGILDGHHVLTKERVKQRFPFGALKRPDALEPLGRDQAAGLAAADALVVRLGDLLSDPRLGVLACRRHHGLIENGVLTIARQEVPIDVESAAVEYGLDAWLDRDYGGR